MGLFDIFKRKDVKLDGFSKKYEPELVTLLKNDHDLLQGLLSELKQIAVVRDMPAFTQKIKDLNRVLKNHLIVENIKFYSYIEEKYADNETLRKQIHAYRIEMESIGVVINRFINTYNKEALGAADWELTVPDIENLITLLNRRIDKEELELYALYVK